MIRTIFLITCVLLTLPLLITFDSLLMWKFTLMLGEYGHRVAVFTGLITLIYLKRHDFMVGGVALLATGVLLSPLMQALQMAEKLPREMEVSFGGKVEGAPLSVKELFVSHGGERAMPQEHVLPEKGTVPARRMLFYPAVDSSKASPCILMIHGGGWQSGTAEEFPEWSTHWAQSGYAVMSLDYRLAPEWQWPAPLEDVRESLAYLKSHALELKIDAGQLVLLGRSAGGQIATAAVCELKDPAIKGCISLYGPGDMVFARKFADPEDVLDSMKLLRQYMGGDPEQVPLAYQEASATLRADSTCPPMLLVHGQRDILVWHLQSRRLAEQLKQAGVPHHFLDLRWATHGLDYPLHGPGAQLTRYAVDQFLARVVKD